MSRSLAFDGCTFELVDGVMEASSEMCFNNAADLWAQLHRTIEILHRNGDPRRRRAPPSDSDENKEAETGDFFITH